MPRLPRLSVEDTLYFVRAYGAHGKTLFADQADYAAYLSLLKQYKSQYGFKLFAYVLCPTMLALCIEPKEGTTISEVMHDLHSRYTKYFNRRHTHKGHLFQSRFKSILVEKESYLLSLTRYLHLIPRRTGLVEDVREYPYSSFLQFVSGEELLLKERPDLTEEAGELLGRYEEGGGRERYEAFVRTAHPAELKDLEKELKRPIVGSPGFVKHVHEKIDAARTAFRDEKTAGNILFQRSGWKMTLAGETATLLSVGLLTFFFYGKTLEIRQEFQTTLAQKAAEFEKRLEAQKEESPFSLVDLNNTEWRIQLTPSTEGVKNYPEKDQLRFAGDRVLSGYFSSNGFPASRYTLSIQEDGTVIWETIQSTEEGYVSWRGETKEGKMKGVLSRHLSRDKRPQVFSFFGRQYKQDGKLIQWSGI